MSVFDFALRPFRRERSTSVVAIKVNKEAVKTATLANSISSQQLSMTTAELLSAVKTPKDETQNEWLASHGKLVTFFGC